MARRDGRIAQDPDRVFRRRVRSGLTQEALAELAGVSLSTMSRIENGAVSASGTSLHRLAAALECEVDDLMPVEPAVAS